MHVLHILKTEPDEIVVELMAAFDEEKRALHDRICSTRVVRKA